jgi:thiol-disulfide isomerase/thioredoxin
LEKAKALASEMAGPDNKLPQWADRLTYIEALIKTREELAAKQLDAALATLKTVEKQKDQGSDKQWYLLRAQALDVSGKTADAITTLRDSFVAEPTDRILEALREYGSKADRSSAQIEEDIWAGYQAKAENPKPLALKRLDNGQVVSLADYKGKPVIVDFWYPQCGPCRASFPYLQKIAAKYKNKGLTVLAITSIEEQQPFALPYLVQKNYDFVGLAGGETFSATWGVESYPTTFLIGADGKIYMKPTIFDAAHQRSTELAVEQMLAHGS